MARQVFVELKTKAPGEHATMVETHHELLRRTILKIEDQCKAEGSSVLFAVIVAEAVLAKNTEFRWQDRRHTEASMEESSQGWQTSSQPARRNSTVLQAVCAVTPVTITAFVCLPWRPWSKRRRNRG